MAKIGKPAGPGTEEISNWPVTEAESIGDPASDVHGLAIAYVAPVELIGAGETALTESALNAGVPTAVLGRQWEGDNRASQHNDSRKQPQGSHYWSQTTVNL